MSVQRHTKKMMRAIHKLPNHEAQYKALISVSTACACTLASYVDLDSKTEELIPFFDCPDDPDQLLLIALSCFTKFDELMETNQE